MNESKIQAKIINQYELQGWYVIKLITTNKNGIPDLLCLKEKDILFIEVKSEKGKLSELQNYRIKELQENNFKVLVKYQ